MRGGFFLCYYFGMFKVLINYNHIPDWMDDDNYLILDRSNSRKYLKTFDQSKIIYTHNWGNVDFDKLGYIVDNYDNLCDVFLLSKTNIFKFITKEEWDDIKDNQFFTPVLTQYHKTYSDRNGVVCYYQNGIYYERNDSWYVPAYLTRYLTYNDFAKALGLPTPEYLPFAPGGSYIVTKEAIHRYPKKFYEKMIDMLNYTQEPAEAHFIERTYFTLWS